MADANVVDRTNTNVSSKIKKLVQGLRDDADLQSILKWYQYISSKFMTTVDINARGLLLHLPMGYGKTITAASVIHTLELAESGKIKRKVVVLLTKSLQENFKKGIREYFILLGKDPENKLPIPKDIEHYIATNFSFVSMNSSNMMQQLNRAADGDLEALESAALESKIAEVMKVGTLDNKILIVDEAHNLFRAISNGNARGFYDMVMNARNLKILFLTGTPVVNDPFELVPCFNMLGSQNRKHATLPETYYEFYQMFVDNVTNKPKNAAKLQNRIMGLVSSIDPGDKPPKDFPRKLPDKVIRVPMGNYQYGVYNVARMKEKEESRGGLGDAMNAALMQKPKTNAASTYRVKSRQYCNFVLPKGVESLAGVTKDQIKDCSALYSFTAGIIIERAKKGQIGYMYSQFTGVGGLAAMVHILKLHNFEEYKEGMAFDKSKMRYAVFSGDKDIKERTKLQNAYSCAENKHGGYITALLLSSTGAEGLDLKNSRYCFGEPYWNDSRGEQIKARGWRYMAGMHLDEKDRDFQYYMLLATVPKEISDAGGKDVELTTHEDLYFKSKRSQSMIDSFVQLIREVSIECFLQDHPNYKCRMCNPSNRPLFHWDFSKDTLMSDPCKELVETKIKAKQVIVDGRVYYFTKSGSPADYKILTYNSNIGAYTKMKPSDEKYKIIVSAVKAADK